MNLDTSDNNNSNVPCDAPFDSSNSVEQIIREFAIDYLCYIRMAELGCYDEEGNLVDNRTLPIVSSLRWAEESLNTVSGTHLLNFLKKRIPHLINPNRDGKEREFPREETTTRR
jgi:hypothetical protein